MHSLHQRQWSSHRRQRILLEFTNLKYNGPEGIYLSLIPGEPYLWSGVLFVRKGPYATAILRFQVTFPLEYPSHPPSVTFQSEIFHPLVTPLTTYTSYSSSSTSANTHHGQLRPGGLSLRFGFPQWFEVLREMEGTEIVTAGIEPEEGKSSNLSITERSPSVQRSWSAETLERDGRGNGYSEYNVVHKSRLDHLNVIKVLEYTKKVFEDDALLDALPLDAAGNQGAWHAWQAHRRAINREMSNGSPGFVENVITKEMKSPIAWNWDGVWADRVKRGISASVSDSVLYGNIAGDTIINFLDLNDETVNSIKEHISLK